MYTRREKRMWAWAWAGLAVAAICDGLVAAAILGEAACCRGF
jgi:hypothetical protein